MPEAITPETINEMFDNARNRLEGWGVFLVQKIDGMMAIEVQRVDEMETFETDAGARAHFRKQVNAGSERHVAVAQEINRINPAYFMALFMSKQARAERFAK